MSETIEPFSEKRFRELWNKGMSTTEIGRVFGKTKGSISGLRMRLDLPPRETGGPHSTKRSTKRKAFEDIIEPNVGKGISFEKMASDRTACKWPINNGDPFRFCGAKRQLGSAYCEYHHAVSYRPARAA
jgi:hypothetical protein